MNQERVYFFDDHKNRARAERLFELEREKLQGMLPKAEIRHVGSTATPGCLTKGDLDIQVCVPDSDFHMADTILAAHYARNTGSDRTLTFSSFQRDTSDPPLGVQLTVLGGPEDNFARFRDLLRERPDFLQAYNHLKQRFEGQSMADYRHAKAIFIEHCLSPSS